MGFLAMMDVFCPVGFRLPVKEFPVTPPPPLLPPPPRRFVIEGGSEIGNGGGAVEDEVEVVAGRTDWEAGWVVGDDVDTKEVDDDDS